MEKSTFIYFSLGEFGRLEMFSLIAWLGSAHLRIGGSCQWALRNVTLQEGILYCECLEEILAHGSSHVMQAGDLCCGAVAHSLMGARCGCGLGAGLGWAWGALVPSPEAGVPVPLTASLLRGVWGSTSHQPHGEGLRGATMGLLGRPVAESGDASVRFP